MIIRIGYSGTRLGMTAPQVRAIYLYLSTVLTVNDWNDPVLEVRHGDCIGGDAEFHVIARCLAARVITCPPADSSRRAWCKADEVRPVKDYLARDWDIASESGELLAAPSTGQFERRSGTWTTIGYTVQLGRPAKVFTPDGRMRLGSDLMRAAR